MKMKLTRDKITQHIVKTEFLKLGEKTTVCLLTLDNGFEVVGTSSCIDKNEYNQETGELMAEDDAISKCWELYGFAAHLIKVVSPFNIE